MLQFKKTFNRIDELINIEYENPILKKVCNNSLGESVGLNEEKADKVISEIESIINCKDIYTSYEGYLNNKDKFSNLALKCSLGEINCKNPIFDNRDFLLELNYNNEIVNCDYRDIDKTNNVQIEKNYLKTNYNEYLIEFNNNCEFKNILIDYIMESIYSLGNKDKYINIKNFNSLYEIIGNKIDELTNYAILIRDSNDYNIIKNKGLFDESIKEFKDYLINYINEDAISNELDYIIKLLLFQINIYVNKILEKVKYGYKVIIADENGVTEEAIKKEYKNPRYLYIKVPSGIDFYEDLNINDNSLIIKDVRCKLNCINKENENLLYTNKFEKSGNYNIILNGDNLFCESNIKVLSKTLLNEKINIKNIIFITKKELKDSKELLSELDNYLKSYPVFSKYCNYNLTEKYGQSTIIYNN